jgi:hypothetical protein
MVEIQIPNSLQVRTTRRKQVTNKFMEKTKIDHNTNL